MTFVVAALGKFGGDPMVVATLDRIGFGDWFRYLLGVLEILGAVALFVPRLAGLKRLAFVVVVGAVVVTVAVAGGSVVLPLALLILSAVIAWGRWRSTSSLWNALSRRRS